MLCSVPRTSVFHPESREFHYQPLPASRAYSKKDDMMSLATAFYSKEKGAIKKIIQHLIHPGYILFDWEFYSNALEFES